MDLALKEEDQAFAASFRSWLGEHLRRPPAFADLADEVAWGRNWHAASTSICPTDSPLGPSGLFCCVRTARMTASRVASSSLLKSTHFIVSAFGGAPAVSSPSNSR